MRLHVQPVHPDGEPVVPDRFLPSAPSAVNVADLPVHAICTTAELSFHPVVIRIRFVVGSDGSTFDYTCVDRLVFGRHRSKARCSRHKPPPACKNSPDSESLPSSFFFFFFMTLKPRVE